MSISPRNLWPEDIAVTQVVAPVAILKEQASMLGERTMNLVEGRVKQNFSDSGGLRFPKPSGKSRATHSGDDLYDSDFSYDFDLVAPALNNYRYRLFSISHGVEFYPLLITNSAALTGDGIEVPHEEGFLAMLEMIFSSEKTKGIISSLIAQSRA
jgi:hypothetical protein